MSLRISAVLGINGVSLNELNPFVRGRLLLQLNKYRMEQWYKLWFGLVVAVFKFNNEHNIKNFSRRKFEINLVSGVVKCEFIFDYNNGTLNEDTKDDNYIVSFNKGDIEKYVECMMTNRDDNWNGYFMAVIQDYEQLHMTLRNTNVELCL